MNEETGNVSSNFLLKSVEYVLISLSHQLISDNSKSVSCLNRGRFPLAQKSCYCSIHFFYYFIIGGIRFINLSFVVIGNNGFDITHAAIAQFKRVPVENFM